MSRLIEKLTQVSKDAPQPIGFRVALPISSKPPMLLVVSLTQIENIDNPADSVTGADAVLLHSAKGTPGSAALQKIAPSLPDIPWGSWLEDTSEKRMEMIAKSGADFVVFPTASAVLAADQEDKMGKILQVQSSLNEGLLKAVNNLPVDAVLAVTEQEKESSLTWQHLMALQRFVNLLTKPLLASMPPNVTYNELKALWEIGVDGVVVEVSAKQPAAKLEKLRQAINRLASLPPRKRVKVEALIPHFIGELETAADIEEDDEEE